MSIPFQSVFRLAVVLLLALAVIGTNSKAVAGDYTVKQCLGSSFEGFSGGYFNLNTLDRVNVVRGCQLGEPTKLGIYQDRSGRPVQGSGGGQFIWSPDPSIRITGTTFSARLRDVGGMRVQLFGPRSAGGQTVLDEGQPHDGQIRTTRWRGEESRPAIVIARLWCVRSGGCENNEDTPKAYLEIYDMEIESRDFLPPDLEVSGRIWDHSHPTDWLRGPAEYRIDSTDRGSGVSRATVEVNGLTVGLPGVSCPGDRGSYVTAFNPCPGMVERRGSLDSSAAPFRDGLNSFRFCVSDFAIPREAANQTCTGQRTVLIDNTPPLAPLGFEVAGSSGWRSTNGFDFSWQTPSGQASPVVSAEYRVIDLKDGFLVDEGSVSGTDPQSFGPVEVPAAGEYRVDVRLRDKAGNLGAPASTVVRFDDSPPGDVEPEAPGGWISDDELPLRLPVKRAVSGGPSGIGGYAVTVSNSGPTRPCASGFCSLSELTPTGGPDSRSVMITGLLEGNHWVSAVAASGAGLSSLRPGSALLRVDRTDPETSISGVPTEWVNRPVTVLAEASDELSGMVARPGIDDGTPMVAIAPTGQFPYESPGARASFTVVTEGTTTVRYWAMDLAGNVNDGRLASNGARHAAPDSATVRIDVTPPVLRFSPEPDLAIPELVSVEVSDSLSGLDSGRIGIRRLSDEGAFTQLETELAGDSLRARIPSDDLPAGVYELRATATDRAGNSGSSVSREDGSAMVLSLPLKREVELSLHHLDRSLDAGIATFAHGKPVQLAGRISDQGGTGIPDAGLILEQRFSFGSLLKVLRSTVFSDVTGRFSVELKAGPGRDVRVFYEGTDLNGRASSQQLKLAFRDQTTLSITPEVLRNGARTTMQGTVAGMGAAQPAAGKLVAIEFFDPDRRLWRPVELLRADRRGHFRYSYRFRTITSPQRILFRAVSLAEAGWPYRPSKSAPKSVVVYPSQLRQ
ncbi:MAG: hypothetical protein WEB05_02550 [Solirubrobacterales bacterium]